MKTVAVVALLGLSSCATGKLEVRFPDDSEKAELHVCHRESPTKMWCLDYGRFMRYLEQHGGPEQESGEKPDFSPDPAHHSTEL